MAEFQEVIRQMNRMCNSISCEECKLVDGEKYPTDCEEYMIKRSKKAEKRIMQWAEENPEKTMLDDLIEKYPYVKLNNNGLPQEICPYMLGHEDRCKYRAVDDCKVCWNRPLRSDTK